jgi:hypothetical protein
MKCGVKKKNIKVQEFMHSYAAYENLEKCIIKQKA